MFREEKIILLKIEIFQNSLWQNSQNSNHRWNYTFAVLLKLLVFMIQGWKCSWILILLVATEYFVSVSQYVFYGWDRYKFGMCPCIQVCTWCVSLEVDIFMCNMTQFFYGSMFYPLPDYFRKCCLAVLYLVVVFIDLCARLLTQLFPCF